MEEQAEQPELRSGEMPGFAMEDEPGPEWDADDVAASVRDDPPGAWGDPADAWDDPPGAPEAAGWPEEERPATGEPRVDAALARLDELAGRPITEHRAIFEDVHRRLRDVLGELDTREQSSGDQPAAAGAERRAGR
jgi:hypothetical protein